MSYFNFVATIPFHIGEHVNCIHFVTTTSHFLSNTFHVILSLSATYVEHCHSLMFDENIHELFSEWYVPELLIGNVKFQSTHNTI